ncbi:DUF2268 domain-containing protein [Herbivorax sp. ANBcel31]|uniref:DUF2268 domain-containing protein n=1 Tax=Herbivorax sp. ANBcel31 TaxID=3069754 RepID=UPI0027AF141F|nr:DUF2268 domain-containing protein [Herbivorax sp. ANBcel31]MDQ2088004.1 DUF2268 domain-containing protein [Herbivorax sp. ANBcel31]
MKINMIRSDKIYRKMAHAIEHKRNDIYRYELMNPFKFKWECINVPIKASHEGGYDVVMASSMLGFLPPIEVDESHINEIELISDENLWKECERTISSALKRFEDIDFDFDVNEYNFTILLANPESSYVVLSNGYSGDGGIPGYILLSLVPNDYTMSHLQAALAHECNHNVRWQYQKWNINVTLADMIISEGLAENFATSMFGEEHLGPWVSKTDLKTLNNKIKPIIKEGLDATGFDNITAYLYGDEIAELQGFFPVGLSYCAGYACGYYLIKYYLRKTGKLIEEATITSTKEIMKEVADFW